MGTPLDLALGITRPRLRRAEEGGLAVSEPAVIVHKGHAVEVTVVPGGYTVSWRGTPLACFSNIDELLVALRNWMLSK